MIIQSILSSRAGALLTIGEDASLKEAAKLLTEKRIGALPVTDDDNLVGIISERDIVRICAQADSGAMESLVKGAMTSKVETAAPGDKIENALARMTDRRIRHLPVVENGKLVGIVSIGDLVKCQIDEVLREADAMRNYIQS